MLVHTHAVLLCTPFRSPVFFQHPHPLLPPSPSEPSHHGEAQKDGGLFLRKTEERARTLFPSGPHSWSSRVGRPAGSPAECSSSGSNSSGHSHRDHLPLQRNVVADCARSSAGIAAAVPAVFDAVHGISAGLFLVRGHAASCSLSSAGDVRSANSKDNSFPRRAVPTRVNLVRRDECVGGCVFVLFVCFSPALRGLVFGTLDCTRAPKNWFKGLGGCSLRYESVQQWPHQFFADLPVFIAESGPVLAPEYFLRPQQRNNNAYLGYNAARLSDFGLTWTATKR